MRISRFITALFLVLSLIVSVCDGCAIGTEGDTCCPEPCESCACYVSQATEQPPTTASPSIEARPDAVLHAFGMPGRVSMGRPTALSRARSGHQAPASPPRLSMLSAYRI